MTPQRRVVFLVDVDDTLLENDRIQGDIQRPLEREYWPAARECYWAIQEELFTELGYRDYLGALQRYRVEHPYQPHLSERIPCNRGKGDREQGPQLY
jgi:hypothetical protein